jgi:hypothetical protein
MGSLENDKYKGSVPILNIFVKILSELSKVCYICSMSRLKRIVIFSIFLFSIPLIGNCQAPPTPPSGGAPPCGGPFGTVCPIDGGVSLLIAAGAALGGKKAFDLKKKKAS